MRIEPEVSGVTVVLVGNFNPAILTPAWFSMHGLLPKAVADSANLEVAHPEATIFSTEWLHVEATTDRFIANTQQAPHVRVRDLVVRLFAEHLRHTPTNALGINRNVHFRVGSASARDEIGRALAPTAPWGAWREELELDTEHGGMATLTMSQYRPKGRPVGGRISVTVEPSNHVGGGRDGVYVRVNDHYVTTDRSVNPTAELMEYLNTRFDESIRRSDRIIDHIMSLAKEPVKP